MNTETKGDLSENELVAPEPRIVSGLGICVAASVAIGIGKTISYPEKLLKTAVRLFKEGEFSIAVVVAHMACEVQVERTLSAAFTSKGIEYLGDAVTEMMSGYNLGNDRNRDLFIALTGKTITNEAFWPKFKESAARRNKAIHEGKVATKPEAEESLKAVEAFLAYVK